MSQASKKGRGRKPAILGSGLVCVRAAGLPGGGARPTAHHPVVPRVGRGTHQALDRHLLGAAQTCHVIYSSQLWDVQITMSLFTDTTSHKEVTTSKRQN